jgi:membrane protease YdiL (CAAX protease family)
MAAEGLGRDPHTVPSSPLQAACVFGATSLIFVVCLYGILPLLRRIQTYWFVCFNLVLAMPMFALVGLAFWAIKREGRSLQWPVIRDRFRLGAMDFSSWIWTASLAVFMFGGHYADLTAVGVAFAAIAFDRKSAPKLKLRLAACVTLFVSISWLLWLSRPFLAAIPYHPFPRVLQEFLAHMATSGSFMGISTHGHWWIALYYAVVLLFGNIAGEELWWRGYLLPRQELASGSIAWLYHGLFWAGFHVFIQATVWDLIRMVPTCCALTFVAQHRKNTWPGIFAHTAGNLGIMIGIVRGVLG